MSLASLVQSSFEIALKELYPKAKQQPFSATRQRIAERLHQCYSHKQLPWHLLDASLGFKDLGVNIHEGTLEISGEFESELLKQTFIDRLLDLKPWRKGPFKIGSDIHIDTEWRSDMKWNRLVLHINLSGKRVLDIGASSGYYMFRMLEHQPRHIVGIDPYPLFNLQFHLLNQLMATQKETNKTLTYLPLGIEDMSEFKRCFDTIFCMGILYHQKSPIQCLKTIKSLLAPRGDLFLETLIIPTNPEPLFTEHLVFSPPSFTYSKMSNVYFLPTVASLINWLEQAGFSRIEHIDTTVTSTEEQHKTSWIIGQSLEDFLDPNDPSKTIEGYPAPTRVILKASYDGK